MIFSPNCILLLTLIKLVFNPYTCRLISFTHSQPCKFYVPNLTQGISSSFSPSDPNFVFLLSIEILGHSLTSCLMIWTENQVYTLSTTIYPNSFLTLNPGCLIYAFSKQIINCLSFLCQARLTISREKEESLISTDPSINLTFTWYGSVSQKCSPFT